MLGIKKNTKDILQKDRIKVCVESEEMEWI